MSLNIVTGGLYMVKDLYFFCEIIEVEIQ